MIKKLINLTILRPLHNCRHLRHPQKISDFLGISCRTDGDSQAFALLGLRMTKLCRGLILSVLLLPALSYAQNQITPVFVAVVEKKHFFNEVEAIGTLKANENVEITSTVTELITKINFDDGQKVKKGDVLIEMDDTEEQALKAEEISRMEEAKRQVERLKPLVKRGAASKAAIDEKELELQTAKSRIKAIESRINKRKITAPFDGVVGQRNISVGKLSQPGTLITTLDDISIMKLDFAVPEIFVPTLKAGVDIESEASAWPKEVFKGKISSVNSRIDPVTRSITVRAILENDGEKLVPGMLMKVKLKKNPRETLVIPEEALVIRGEKNSVFVIKEQDEKTIVTRAEVEVGRRRQGEVEILGGLNKGDKIVSHGTLRVRDGAEVKVEALEKNNETLKQLLNQKNKEG